MSYWLFAVAAVFVTYGLAARRLSRAAVTGPMVFVAADLIMGSSGLDLLDTTPDSEAVTALLEITLAVVLFSDANAINGSAWREEAFIPGRLLLVGMPTTILLGFAAAVALFTDLGIWEAALIGAILAPTDASLGQGVISNPRVPQRMRQGLNVESGLNDRPFARRRVPTHGRGHWFEPNIAHSAFPLVGQESRAASSPQVRLGSSSQVTADHGRPGELELMCEASA